MVFLAKHNRYASSSAGTDKHTKGSAKILNWESDSNTSHHIRIVDSVTNYNRVNYIVERHHHSANDSGETIFQKNLPDRCRRKLYQSRVGRIFSDHSLRIITHILYFNLLRNP